MSLAPAVAAAAWPSIVDTAFCVAVINPSKAFFACSMLCSAKARISGGIWKFGIPSFAMVTSLGDFRWSEPNRREAPGLRLAPFTSAATPFPRGRCIRGRLLQFHINPADSHRIAGGRTNFEWVWFRTAWILARSAPGLARAQRSAGLALERGCNPHSVVQPRRRGDLRHGSAGAIGRLRHRSER